MNINMNTNFDHNFHFQIKLRQHPQLKPQFKHPLQQYNGLGKRIKITSPQSNLLIISYLDGRQPLHHMIRNWIFFSCYLVKRQEICA